MAMTCALWRDRHSTSRRLFFFFFFFYTDEPPLKRCRIRKERAVLFYRRLVRTAHHGIGRLRAAPFGCGRSQLQTRRSLRLLQGKLPPRSSEASRSPLFSFLTKQLPQRQLTQIKPKPIRRLRIPTSPPRPPSPGDPSRKPRFGTSRLDGERRGAR